MEKRREEPHLIAWIAEGVDPREGIVKREALLYFEMALLSDEDGMIALTPVVIKRLKEKLGMGDRTFMYGVEGLVVSGLVKKISAQDFMLNPSYTTTSWSNDRNILIEEYNKM